MARDIPLPGQRRKLFNEKKRARRRESEGDRRRPARRFSFPPRRRREIGVTTDGLISVPRRIDLNTICCLCDFAARRRQKSDRVRKDGGEKRERKNGRTFAKYRRQTEASTGQTYSVVNTFSVNKSAFPS